MDEILVANFMVFDDLVRDEPYDLWVGDEAWDLDYFLHENPELKRAPYAWLTDFVGWLPMPSRRPARGGADRRLQRRDGRARSRASRGCATAPVRRQPGRHRRRPARAGPAGRSASGPSSTSTFTGYVGDVAPVDRDRLRHELGWAPDETVCVVTVGGSGVGGDLLRRVVDAFPAARERVPGLRMVVVAGPRIDPARLPRARGARGARVRAPTSHRLLAACDLARHPRRADHDDGADRAPAPVPLRPAAQPLRAELPRAPPARPLRRRAMPRRGRTLTPEALAAAMAAEIGRAGRLPAGGDRRRRAGRGAARRAALSRPRRDLARGGQRRHPAGAGRRAQQRREDLRRRRRARRGPARRGRPTRRCRRRTARPPRPAR